MRAALGLALIFGGSVLALMALQGRVPLTGATSAPVSGGTAHPTTTKRTVNDTGGGLP